MGVRGKIEAVLYAAEEPATLAQLAALFGADALAEQAASTAQEQLDLPVETDATSLLDAASIANPQREVVAVRQQERAAREAVRRVLSDLVAAYTAEDRGMEIREIAGGYRVATKPEYHDAVRSFAKSLTPPMKLSLQALETLAVVAYKQPVTAPEISDIRGVDSGGVLGSLMSRKLVTTAGRKQVLGRPILYKTTREFLLRFGLKDLNELPSMEEFEKMAGELRALGDETEASGEQAAPPALAEAEALETPAEPELSLIVEDEEPAAEPGMQVEPGGAARPDDAAPTPDEDEHG